MLWVVNVWDQVRRLQGRKLATLGQGKAFDVGNIANDGVEIRLHSTDKRRRVYRRVIEPAWKLLESAGSLTQKEIKAGPSPINSPYVAAILAAVPGVKYTCQPVVELRLAKSS